MGGDVLHFASTHIYLIVAIITVLCIMAGILTYYFVEKPSVKYLTLKYCSKSENPCGCRERERERVILLSDNFCFV